MNNPDIVAATEILANAVEDQTAEQLAAAQARIAEAEAMAQRLSDAALQTELGRQVSVFREEISSWRTATENQLAILQGTLQAIQSRMETPPSAVVVAPQLPAQHSSTLEASEQADLIDPAQAADAGAGDHAEAEASEQAERKLQKKRRIM